MKSNIIKNTIAILRKLSNIFKEDIIRIPILVSKCKNERCCEFSKGSSQDDGDDVSMSNIFQAYLIHAGEIRDSPVEDHLPCKIKITREGILVYLADAEVPRLYPIQAVPKGGHYKNLFLFYYECHECPKDEGYYVFRCEDGEQIFRQMSRFRTLVKESKPRATILVRVV